MRNMQTSEPDISNLKKCIADVKNSILANELGPPDTLNYNLLIDRLKASQNKLPPLYRESFFEPYLSTLNQIGEGGFTSVLLADPTKEREARLMLDIAHTIIQNGEGYNEVATDAFQEVASDLYDGFLSAEDRKGIDPPDRGTIPPLVKWGDRSGPYTWPIVATSVFGVKAPVVNLPPAHSRSGLLGWSSLGHETAGHDILHADTGLHEELSVAVQTALEMKGLKGGLPEYWSVRIDETASDVLGILNMGPAAGIGVLGYFRGLNAAYTGEEKLRNIGGQGPHPADILRGYLAADTVRLLSFKEANNWAEIIESETDNDVATIVLEGKKVSTNDARKSAEVVASTIFNAKMKALENHALGEIQDWRDQDEEIVKNELIPFLTTARELPATLSEGIYAAHVVAASVEAALSKNVDISPIFTRMLNALKLMHDTNPSWGPLFVRQPGNIARHMVHDFESNGRQMQIVDSSLRKSSKASRDK